MKGRMLSEMHDELPREIRKLEVRMEGYLKEEDAFVKRLRECIHKFRELNKNLESLKKDVGLKEVEELMSHRFEAIKAYSEMMKKASEAEHEKSHLLESYGSLLLALEEEFKELFMRLEDVRV